MRGKAAPAGAVRRSERRQAGKPDLRDEPAAGELLIRGQYTPGGGRSIPRFDPAAQPNVFRTPAQQQQVQQPVAEEVFVQPGQGVAPGGDQPFDPNALESQVGEPIFGVPGEGQPFFEGPEPFVDIVASGEETETGRLLFGVGVNSDAGVVGSIVLDEQNFDLWRFPSGWEDFRTATAFRGAGQQFRVEAVPGTQVQRYMINFREPYLFDTPVSFGISGFFFDRNYRDWEEQRFGGRISLGYQIRPDLSATVSFRGENINIHNPQIPTPPELTEVLGDNELYSVKGAIAHDTRDNAFLPTEGHLIELGVEQAFGSFDFPVATAEVRQYFLIHERPDTSGRHVLSVGGQVGFAGSNTPLFEHFFAGGFTTLRGFDFRGASPLNMGVRVGGEFQLLGSVEYIFPLTQDDAVRGVVFCDFGTVERNTRLDADTFRVSPGFGLRITVPGLGPAPIALDLSVPVHHAPGDDIENFSFFIGLLR